MHCTLHEHRLFHDSCTLDLLTAKWLTQQSINNTAMKQGTRTFWVSSKNSQDFGALFAAKVVILANLSIFIKTWGGRAVKKRRRGTRTYWRFQLQQEHCKPQKRSRTNTLVAVAGAISKATSFCFKRSKPESDEKTTTDTAATATCPLRVPAQKGI